MIQVITNSADMNIVLELGVHTAITKLVEDDTVYIDSRKLFL